MGDCLLTECIREPHCHGASRKGGLLLILRAMANGKQPCCVDLLLTMMIPLFDFLRKQNTTHMLTSGSLLGSIRSDDLIPWSNDFDIAVPAYVISKLMSPIWQQTLQASGITVF